MYRYSINILIFSFNFSKNNNSDSVVSFGSLKKCIHTEIQCCGTAPFFVGAQVLQIPEPISAPPLGAGFIRY